MPKVLPLIERVEVLLVLNAIEMEKIKKVLFSILFLTVCTGCKSQDVLQHSEVEDIKSVINALGTSNKNKNL